jgi:hypothetical protein
VAACLLAATPGLARAQGEFALKFQDADFGDPLLGMGAKPAEMLPAKPDALKALPKDLSDKALYFALPLGEKKMFGVVDPTGPKLFLDTAGSGDLSAAKPIAQNKKADGPIQLFDPVAIPVPGGKDPATVKVRLGFIGGRMILAYPAGYMAGEIKLGGQTYKVALIDNSLEGQFNRTLPIPLDRDKPMYFDSLAIDLNQNGKFDIDNWDASESQPLFPMIHVKDAYYSVKVAPGGASLTLAKVEPKMGTLETGMPDATLAVVGECGIQRLTGGDGKYPVPAGQYSAIQAIVVKADKDGAKWTINANGQMGKLAALDVPAGGTLKVKFGAPLAVKTAADKGSPGAVDIGFIMEGQSGEQYGAVQKENTVSSPPKVKVVDEKGKVLGEGTFEYG